MQNALMGGAFPDVVRSGENGYRVTLDPSWDLAQVPQGGVVTALAVRAMADAVDNPDQTLRTAHTTFVAQVPHGPLDIEVEVLRRGRSMSHVRAEVRAAGSAHGHLTTAVFGAPRRGFAFTDLEPPTRIVPPSQCRSFRAPLPPEADSSGLRAPCHFGNRHVEGAGMLGHAPWERLRTGRGPSMERGTEWTTPPWRATGHSTRGRSSSSPTRCRERWPRRSGRKSASRWFGPSVDLTFHLLGDCRSAWVLAHNRARHAGDGYASIDMALWDCGPRRDRPTSPRRLRHPGDVLRLQSKGRPCPGSVVTRCPVLRG